MLHNRTKVILSNKRNGTLILNKGASKTVEIFVCDTKNTCLSCSQ